MIHCRVFRSFHLVDSSVPCDPATEIVSTIESIRPSTSYKNEKVWFFRKENEMFPITARDVPWDCSNDLSGCDEGATAVSLADTLSSKGESANLVFEDELCVASGVSFTTISVGQCGCGQPLEVVWSGSSGDRGTTPSWDDGVNSTSNMAGSEGNWLNIGVEGHYCSSTDDWDTGVQRIVKFRTWTQEPSYSFEIHCEL